MAVNDTLVKVVPNIQADASVIGLVSVLQNFVPWILTLHFHLNNLDLKLSKLVLSKHIGAY